MEQLISDNIAVLLAMLLVVAAAIRTRLSAEEIGEKLAAAHSLKPFIQYGQKYLPKPSGVTAVHFDWIVIVFTIFLFLFHNHIVAGLSSANNISDVVRQRPIAVSLTAITLGGVAGALRPEVSDIIDGAVSGIDDDYSPTLCGTFVGFVGTVLSIVALLFALWQWDNVVGSDSLLPQVIIVLLVFGAIILLWWLPVLPEKIKKVASGLLNDEEDQGDNSGEPRPPLYPHQGVDMEAFEDTES